jgi:NAD(P)-dependent dehydrogenase (short-subunit alcohol dehydrogenase family)
MTIVMDRNVALITGGSRGIGAAAAKLLAAEGWAVAINYRADKAAAEATAKAVEAAGGAAMIIQADTGVEADVIRMFEVLDAEWGRLDALVNNAGVVGPRGPFGKVTAADIQHVLSVNVTGYMLCAQQAVSRMSTKSGGKGGGIINVSSGSAQQGGGGEQILYAASKGAVNSLTIGLSQEFGPAGIRVNTVSPGLTATDMPPQDKLDSAGPSIPLGRVGEAEEVAEGIVWLLSAKASYVAGAYLRISGGRP